MMTLEDLICQHAAHTPNKVAAVCGEETLTYSELWQQVLSRAEDFRHKGPLPSLYQIFRSRQDLIFLVDYFATHVAGRVAVPLEKDAPEQRLEEITNQLEGITLPDDTADILFTTGTTGKSKGVMVSHRAIMANTDNLVEGHQYSPDLHFVICGPLNHLGSLSKIYPTFAVGGTLHILEGMKDTSAFFDVLSGEGKYATFLVPASIRMLLQVHERRLHELGNKIDFIETGAAPMTQDDMERLRQTLPKTRLYNTFASTETGIVSTCDFSNGDSRTGCVGKAMKHSAFFIDDNGLVTCTGDTLMSGYAGNPTLTQEVMCDGAVHTCDRGEIDADGNLFLLGRKDDIINVSGYKVEPTEVEEMAMKHPSVADCICVSATHPIIGTVLRLLVVPYASANFNKRELYLFLSHRLEAFKVPFYYEKVEKIERTYNGKNNRKFYC